MSKLDLVLSTLQNIADTSAEKIVQATGDATSTSNVQITDYFGALIGAGIVMIAGAGSGIGQGYIGGKSIEAMARNPEVHSKIFTQYIIAAAVCETVAIYCLLIAIILIFVVK